MAMPCTCYYFKPKSKVVVLLRLKPVGASSLIRILMPCPSIGPKWFWTIQIILVEHQSFWTGPICFGLVQIIKFCPEKSNLTLPKFFGPDQKNWYSTKKIWMVQIHFGAIEGQGMKCKHSNTYGYLELYLMLRLESICAWL